MEKPVFIPLKKVYYLQFANGMKKTEYRQYGRRWNEKVCRIGRSVLLSCGYGNKNRMRGIITDFRKVPVWKSLGGADYLINYGVTEIGPVAEIDIKIMQEEITMLAPEESEEAQKQQPTPQGQNGTAGKPQVAECSTSAIE